MGASIYWQPVKGRNITPGARSEFVGAFERIFGPMPYTLRQADYDKVSAAAAVWPSRNTDDNPWTQLCDALLDHEEIRVWAEY